jgi:antitoxin ParD1/3/4
MTTMSIAVPAKMKKEVESRVKAGGYGNVSEYVRELIRTDPTIRQAYIEARLLEGVRSGRGPIANDAYWRELDQKLEQSIVKRSRGR